MDAPHDSSPHRPEMDEAYWASLLEQEETLVPPPPPPDAKGENWIPVQQRVDGRFRWADGGKPEEDEAWELAQDTFKNDETLKLLITDHNKGGLLVNWNGLQGFIPASQLINFPRFHIERERIKALQQWVHKILQVKIIEVNPTNKRLIFSERAAQVKAEHREALLHRIQRGDIRQGRITNLTKFGAFVDLGGLEGLIHLSELSWSRVTHPSEIVKPGQVITVKVLDVDQHKERVALSRKRLKPNPWQAIEERYQPGQVIEGIVNNIVSFGVFVLIEEELEGLIHLSELAEGSFLHPRDIVSDNQPVRVRILEVDGPNNRLALSLRNVT
ncbi:MAG: S1 RNA-binding domain-containing protein [Ardenticatenaceae bacterium]|nr:S1 RNA-binding domain-containing protein [Ardenticatenaceae bacterium]